MQDYKADTAWNRGISCSFFHITDPNVFVLCLSLFWIIVSKMLSKAIFLDIIFKSVCLWGSYGMKQGKPLQFFKTLIQLYSFNLVLYFWLTVSERVSNAICLDIKFKSVGRWGSYVLKQGNPLQFFKTLIQLYLFDVFLYFWLTVSKRVSKAIFLEIKFKSIGRWGSYGLKLGNPLQNINISNQIIFGST